MFRNKKILLALVVVVAAAGTLFLLGASGGLDKNSIRIKVAISPSEATFFVDGKKTKPGTVALKKGRIHTLVAKLQYFTDSTATVNPATYNTAETVYLSPLPDSKKAQDWLFQHPEAQQEREALAGAREAAGQEALVAKYPFLTDLPYNNLDYIVGYGTKSDGTVIFHIVILMPNAVVPGTPEYDQLYAQSKSEANDYLIAHNVDPTKVEVTYETRNN